MNKSPNAIDMQVGANIRSRRLRAGLSQEALGEQLGITFQQLQKYEKGTNRVSASRLVMVSRVLRCHVGDLFEGTDDVGLGLETAAALPSVAPQSHASIKGGRLLDAITRKQRTAVLSLLRTLAQSGSTSDDEGEIDD